MKKIKLTDSSYPENLKQIINAPQNLYIKGRLEKKDRLAVAIIGSRKMTEYGEKTAARFAYELAKRKITIVSGLARGIDTVAHQASLAAGGRTIAVLGSGLDIIYPPENKRLAEKIVKSGALVSEFPPGTKPLGENFLIRNRIISGMSLAVLVVEGAKRSGTLSTASYAANQGREVFAIPGPVDSPLSEAPLFLIGEGAAIAKGPKDVLEYLGL
jgi:DNA processing protein